MLKYDVLKIWPLTVSTPFLSAANQSSFLMHGFFTRQKDCAIDPGFASQRLRYEEGLVMISFAQGGMVQLHLK